MIGKHKTKYRKDKHDRQTKTTKHTRTYYAYNT